MQSILVYLDILITEIIHACYLKKSEQNIKSKKQKPSPSLSSCQAHSLDVITVISLVFICCA